MTDRASRAMNLLGKTKMQNQWKILSLLREYLNKTNSNKNIQIVLSKEWIEALQKMTYTQVKSLREFIASGQHLISGNAKENKEDSKSITDGGLTKSTMISPTEKERILHEIKKLEQIKEVSIVVNKLLFHEFSKLTMYCVYFAAIFRSSCISAKSSEASGDKR